MNTTDAFAALRSKTYPAKPYVADRGFEIPGMALLVVGLAATGAVLGFAANYVSQWLYLILLFPIGIGFAMAFVGAGIAQKAKIRNPWISGAAGFLGGILAMATMHYCSYLDFQKEVNETLPELKALMELPPSDQDSAVATIEDQEMREAVSEFLVKARESKTFPGFIDQGAREGVSLNRAGRSGEGLNLGYVGTYIYWAIEMLIVAVIVFLGLRDRTSQPFCTQCSNWKLAEVLGWLRGGKPEVKEALHSGRFAPIIDCQPSTTEGNQIVTLFTCPMCKTVAPLDLKAELVSVNRKGQQKLELSGMATYPGSANTDIRALFVAPPATT